MLAEDVVYVDTHQNLDALYVLEFGPQLEITG